MSFESPLYIMDHFSSVAQSCLTLKPHGLQHARPPCPSPTRRACSNSHPSSRWCHPTISSSVVPFSSHLQSFPAWGSFPMSQFFASGGQNVGVSASASVLPINFQDWFPLGLTVRQGIHQNVKSGWWVLFFLTINTYLSCAPSPQSQSDKLIMWWRRLSAVWCGKLPLPRKIVLLLQRPPETNAWSPRFIKRKACSADSLKGSKLSISQITSSKNRGFN